MATAAVEMPPKAVRLVEISPKAAIEYQGLSSLLDVFYT
jgi:hypothetical protein